MLPIDIPQFGDTAFIAGVVEQNPIIEGVKDDSDSILETQIGKIVGPVVYETNEEDQILASVSYSNTYSIRNISLAFSESHKFELADADQKFEATDEIAIWFYLKGQDVLEIFTYYVSDSAFLL